MFNLSDPDSNEVVPAGDTRFGGDVLLTSQGDGEMIFLYRPAASDQRTTVLNLTTQIDDTAFPTGCGTLYVVDGTLNEVVAITGDFHRGQVFSAVPSDSTVIPGNLATVDLGTGTVTAFGSGFSNPKGLLFVAGEDD
ncbi:MAG TPA: hypothetical protein VGX23_30305 [Actinocrinis sp.]|nr:hypothetical protein [Actinocrinis sp.]